VVAVLSLNWVLLSVILVGALATQVNAASELLRPTLALGLVLLLFQSWLVAALAFFLASFLTFSLSVGLSFSLFLIGSSLSQIRAAFEGWAVKAGTALLPSFESFQLGFKLTYDFPVGAVWVLGVLAYAMALSLALLFGAGALLQRRER
jgi:hypothetical protein